MKEEALKLADKLNGISGHKDNDWNQFNTINKSAQMIRKLVAELDKQGEPVAWLYERPNGAKKIAWVREPHDKAILKETPLYTTPQTKPLSDEEIDDIWAGISTGDDVIDMHLFASAIEERHGIV